uniref:Uncharacterized protein n=1 Tax=Strongyloides venezuelensis TaxID=75913 RepID=A0A0K0G602_STRVS
MQREKVIKMHTRGQFLKKRLIIALKTIKFFPSDITRLSLKNEFLTLRITIVFTIASLSSPFPTFNNPSSLKMKDPINNPRSTAPTEAGRVQWIEQQKQLSRNPALTNEEKRTLMLNQADELKKMLDFFGIEDKGG